MESDYVPSAGILFFISGDCKLFGVISDLHIFHFVYFHIFHIYAACNMSIVPLQCVCAHTYLFIIWLLTLVVWLLTIACYGGLAFELFLYPLVIGLDRPHNFVFSKMIQLMASIFLASAECFLNRLLFFFMGFYVFELWILIINMQNLHVTLWYTIWELQNCMIISHLIIVIKTFTIKVILYRSCPNHIITYILYNESWILKVVVATSGYP